MLRLILIITVGYLLWTSPTARKTAAEGLRTTSNLLHPSETPKSLGERVETLFNGH